MGAGIDSISLGCFSLTYANKLTHKSSGFHPVGLVCRCLSMKPSDLRASSVLTDYL